MEERLIVIDVESNGLRGEPIAIGMVVYDTKGEIVEIYEKRCLTEITDSWVKANVEPKLQNVGVAGNGTLKELLEDFAPVYKKWYLNDEIKANVLMYAPLIVEANLFRLMYEQGLIGTFEAPYVPIDLVSIMAMAGEDPTSTEKYLEKYNIQKPDGNGEHLDTPVYDCISTYLVYRDIITKRLKPLTSEFTLVEE